jgi:hypothetical protein
MSRYPAFMYRQIRVGKDVFAEVDVHPEHGLPEHYCSTACKHYLEPTDIYLPHCGHFNQSLGRSNWPTRCDACREGEGKYRVKIGKDANPLKVGDCVQTTIEARRFLAPDVLEGRPKIVELHGDCVRLDPPAPDFTPNGVPAAWLERVS